MVRRTWAGAVLAAIAAVLGVWIVLFFFLRGRNTLALAPADTRPLHVWLSDLQTRVGEGRNTNPLFTYFFNPIRSVIDAFGTAIADLIAHPVDGRPVPYIGWLGVVVLFTFLAWVLGNWKVALLTLCGLLFMGLQGLWQDSMETLALTIAAVAISLLIGIPLGIWAGMSDGFNRLITPVLDFMQILPSFVYLAPLTLAFLIGPAAAIIATVIYSAPPVIRLTAHGIRSVPSESREAVESLGATRSQELFGALLPMAKRTIVLGINQTIMAALAMVTIAALIAAPGLGQVVIQALSTQDVGTAFNAGLAIVIMAIILDRTTTAASERVETQESRPSPTSIGVQESHRRRRDGDRDLAVLHLPAGGDLPVIVADRVGSHRTRCRHAHHQRRELRDQLGANKFLRGDERHQGRGHRVGPRPAADAAGQLTVVAHLRGDHRDRGDHRGLDLRAHHGRVPRPDPLAARALAGHHGHPGRCAGGHGGRRRARGRGRRVDGPQPYRGQDRATVPGRRADHAVVRVPGSVPGVVLGVAVHRHRGGDRLRRARVDQDHGRRDPRRVARDRRGGPLRRVEHLAGHQQGAAAHGRSP